MYLCIVFLIFLQARIMFSEAENIISKITIVISSFIYKYKIFNFQPTGSYEITYEFLNEVLSLLSLSSNSN